MSKLHAILLLAFVNGLVFVKINIMSKSWAVFSLTWARILQYRTDVLLGTLGRSISFLFVIWIWSRIFSSGARSAGGYDFSKIVTYYLLALIIRNIAWPTIGDKVRHAIKYGELTPFLLRPYNPLSYFWFEHLSRQLFYILMVPITVVLIALFGWNYFSISATPLSWCLFAGFMIMAIANLFWFDLILSFASFWTTEGWAARRIGRLFVNFFAGAVVPLDLMSGTLKNVSLRSPFAMITFWPIKILQGEVATKDAFVLLIEAMLWALVLWMAAIWLWEKGLKRYEAIGI